MMIMFLNDGENAQLHHFFFDFSEIQNTKMIGKIYKQRWSIYHKNISGENRKNHGGKNFIWVMRGLYIT